MPKPFGIRRIEPDPALDFRGKRKSVPVLKGKHRDFFRQTGGDDFQKSGGVGEFGLGQQGELVDGGGPKPPAAGVADREATGSVAGAGHREDGWQGHGRATASNGDTLRCGDSDPCAAVTARAAADEHQSNLGISPCFEEFFKRREQNGIVASVAGEFPILKMTSGIDGRK